ncbi:hypothetical protein [Streptomyces sp. NPDC056188]|uniref:hypothetical protein n=1 Tax=Streptomyces sp. NPDC056188 TaxID=3345740 RepID=UPI0035DCBE8F
MSSTRRAPKRERLARRTENDALRTARRDALAILLSRAQRGVLTPDDAALLRTHVEATLTEADAAREGERGQQRAMEQHRQRVEAAEDAIREAEQRAEQAERQVGILYAVDEGRAHGAQRIMNERDQAQQLAENFQGRAKAYEQRAEQAEADSERYQADHLSACKTIVAMHEAATGRTYSGPVRGVVEDVADVRRRAAEMEQRALDAEEQLTAYRAVLGPRPLDTINAAEQRAEQAEERARLAEGDVRTIRDGIRACGGDPVNVQNLAAQMRMWRNRAQEAEEQAAQQRSRANGWRGHAIETDDRADTYRTAWHSARDRARKHAQRAKEATLRAELGDAVTTETKRLMERRTTTLRRRAEQAEHRAARYRTAWFAARRDRKADRAAMAAERPLVEAGQQALALATPTVAEAADRLRRWAAAGIPAAQLTGPEPATLCAHPAGYDSECPCPPSCTCCQATPARP